MSQSRRRVGNRRSRSAVVPTLEGLEGRQLLAVSITPINPVSVPATKTLFVPVQGTDSSGNPIDYTVTSSNSSVQATVRSGDTFLKISVANYGDMVFQLFDDLAPNTVSEITKLVDENFYNGLTFHRIVPNFVIQGGDPNGDGTGGPGFTFDDEFNANAIFDGSGQLAMANSGPNTNGSQFFVTVGAQRPLDFNYNLFGQIVSGQSVLQAIDAVPTDSNSKPLTPVTITSASIIQDTSDTVLMIQAPAGTGSSTITVTGTDAVDHTNSVQTFQASYAPDTTDDPPFLGTVSNQTTAVGTPISFPLTSTDLQNDPVVYSASEIDSSTNANVQVNGNTVTVTPNAGFTGTLNLQVGVQEQGATSRGSTSDPRDLRTLSVTVIPSVLTAEGAAVSTTTGNVLAHTFATFTANPTGVASNYTATINFGDQSTGAGTIVANASGGYDIVSTHSYATSGSYNTSVTISGPGGASASATSTATITTAQTVPLTVKITQLSDRAEVGRNLTYVLQITNTGGSTIQGVTFTDTLSAGLTFVSSTNAPTSTSAKVISIPVGDIPAGEVATVNVVVRPTANGPATDQVEVDTAAGQSVSQTQQTNVFGGGGFDSTIAYVKAPAGISQHAISFTSDTFAQVLFGDHDGWGGLWTIMAQFSQTGNVSRLDAELAQLAHHIPYGARNLLPIWRQTIASANLSSPTRGSVMALGRQLQQNLLTYLSDHVGTDFNILKSHGNNATDHLLTFNGHVS